MKNKEQDVQQIQCSCKVGKFFSFSVVQLCTLFKLFYMQLFSCAVVKLCLFFQSLGFEKFCSCTAVQMYSCAFV